MVHVKLVAHIYCSLVSEKPSSVSWWTVGCPPKAETTRSLHIPEGNFGVHANSGDGTLGRRLSGRLSRDLKLGRSTLLIHPTPPKL